MSERPELLQSGLRDNKYGSGVKIVQPSNVYQAELGNDCFVGPFVEIQQGVVVGDRTRIQSHSFVCELVVIGEDCFIAHGVMFINDPFVSGGPARGDRSKYRKTVIGNRVSIGTNSTILPVSICDDVTIGAGSVVTKSIGIPGVYAGNPARRLS